MGCRSSGGWFRAGSAPGRGEGRRTAAAATRCAAWSCRRGGRAADGRPHPPASGPRPGPGCCHRPPPGAVTVGAHVAAGLLQGGGWSAAIGSARVGGRNTGASSAQASVLTLRGRSRPSNRPTPPASGTDGGVSHPTRAWSGRTVAPSRCRAVRAERPADHGRSASSPVELAGRQRSSTQVGAPAYSVLRSIASAMAFIPVSFGCTPSPLLYSGRIRSGSVGSANTRSRSTTAS